MCNSEFLDWVEFLSFQSSDFKSEELDIAQLMSYQLACLRWQLEGVVQFFPPKNKTPNPSLYILRPKGEVKSVEVNPETKSMKEIEAMTDEEFAAYRAKNLERWKKVYGDSKKAAIQGDYAPLGDPNG